MPLFGKKETEPKNYSEIFGFLSEDEQVLRELERDWQVVRHGRKLSDKMKTYRIGEVRKLLLTNKRLILLKGPLGAKKEIDYEIPIDNIKSVEERVVRFDIGMFTSYLRIILKNRDVVSLAFVLVGTKALPEHKRGSYLVRSSYFMTPYTRNIIAHWNLAINNLIQSMESR